MEKNREKCAFEGLMGFEITRRAMMIAWTTQLVRKKGLPYDMQYPENESIPPEFQ